MVASCIVTEIGIPKTSLPHSNRMWQGGALFMGRSAAVYVVELMNVIFYVRISAAVVE